MPRFCRHGTLVESCPICRVAAEAAGRSATRPSARAPRGARNEAKRSRSAGGLTIRREHRAQDDGYRSTLAPGLRSTLDAARLAQALAHSSARLRVLANDPPGLYGEVAREPDIEEASWLALLIAYLGPAQEGGDAFAGIQAVRTAWRSGETPALGEPGLLLGPRTSYDPARGEETLLAYRRWAERAGSQSAGLTGDPSWTPEQRFARAHERLALPGLQRRARYDLLVTLGALGRYPLRAPSLLLSEDDPVVRAAKRVFGIGDRLTLERRAQDLATAVGAPVEALDLALENWAREEEITLGVEASADEVLARARETLAC